MDAELAEEGFLQWLLDGIFCAQTQFWQQKSSTHHYLNYNHAVILNPLFAFNFDEQQNRKKVSQAEGSMERP